MEEDDDETVFDLLDQELEMDVNDHITATATEGVQANSGGVTKRDILSSIIQNLN